MVPANSGTPMMPFSDSAGSYYKEDPPIFSTTVTAGKLMCGSVREILEDAKFDGLEIDYIEHGGFLTHNFRVKGNPEHVSVILKRIQKLQEG